MTVKEELELIAKRHGGCLNPEDVVAFARDKTTTLHRQFCWDDSKAAEAYRLWQARQVIRVHVTVLEGSDEQVRAYVSLRQDRGEAGYRRIVDVIADDDLRQTLLEEAYAEMSVFAKKYRVLKELSAVIDAMDKAMDKVAAKTVGKVGGNGKPKAKATKQAKPKRRERKERQLAAV